MLNYLELLLMLMVLLGVLFISSMQPMFMVSSLILIVLLYSYMIYMIMGGYWFSYALVLVMLSGVLVVFTYMVSLVPNENFENYNLLYVVGILLLLVGGYYKWMFDIKYSMISLHLWSSFFSVFNVFMISLLLAIMLIVVWFSYMGYGALRIMF